MSMKRLLDLVNGNTDIILRSGIRRGEYYIRGVRYIDNSNKFNTELLVNLDEMRRYQYTEDSLWRFVCDELKFRLDFAEREYYERLNKKEEEQDHEDS